MADTAVEPQVVSTSQQYVPLMLEVEELSDPPHQTQAEPSEVPSAVPQELHPSQEDDQDFVILSTDVTREAKTETSNSGAEKNVEIVRHTQEHFETPSENERVCRICHLGSPEGLGELMELGCLCKDDLALAHRKCAEAWFNIKTNRSCEICGKTVRNITLKRRVRIRQPCQSLLVLLTVVLTFAILNALGKYMFRKPCVNAFC